MSHLKNFTADPKPGMTLFRATRRGRAIHFERATLREASLSHITLDLDDNSGTERIPRSHPGPWSDSPEGAGANLTEREATERRKHPERATKKRVDLAEVLRRSAFGMALLLPALPTSPTTH